MSVYDEWLEASAALRKAKAEELRLRNAICGTHLEDVLEGSKTNRFGNLKITATAKLNRTIDREVLDAIWADLSEEERECVEYRPTLVLSKYRNFEETGGKITEAITVKPGQATLKIVEEYDDE